MLRLTSSIVACAVFSALPAVAQPAAGNGRKQAEAARAPSGAIRLDGRLDEEAWLQATPITDFVQKEPVEGAPPTDRMEVRFVYDDEALFVGARMYAADVAAVQVPLGRRDNGAQAEHILVELDTYLDRRTAYAFGVTAAGVRLDHYHPSDSESTTQADFDPVWEARTSMDGQGWTAEMWIPLSQLRFNLRDRQIWGLNVHRWVASRNEAVYWVPVPRTGQGWSSLFGELRGIDAVAPRRRFEVLPYVAGSSTLTGNRDPRDPFDDGKNLEGRIGADVKIGFGSNLTLDATVNPDFGQVEADPAEVNLSAFETFFVEKRPFFLEGRRLLAGQGAVYFYSRRIGAAPVGPASGDYVDYPRTSPILSAAKLTGRLPSRTSIGVLGAVTGDRSARTFLTDSSSIHRVRVAPVASYGVARVEQEFGPSASTAGLMVVALHRDLSSGDPLAQLLSRNAFTVSGDSLLRFKEGQYELAFDAGGSYVDGEAGAIDRIQRSSAHYLHRPDNDYAPYDPTRTALVGGKAGVSIGRMGGRHWLWFISGDVESPEFAINDAGRLSTADGKSTYSSLSYRETQPGRFLRNYTLRVQQGNEWNYGGDRQARWASLSAFATWPNFWTSELTTFLSSRVQDARLTRGGPLMEMPRGWNATLDVGSSTAAPTRGNGRLEYGRDEDGGLTFVMNGGFSLRPGPRWEFSVNPGYERRVDTQQFITSADGGGPLTFGRRYVFAQIDRSTYSTQLRLNYTLKPDVNLDVYAEPFAASGRYGHFGELVAARTRQMRETSIDAGGRDFNVESFRSNVVLRWEWRPGSTLYLVWQQDRSELAPIGARAGLRDMFGSLSAAGDNVLAIKANLWLSPFGGQPISR